jgi:predicted ATP-grasp superfamily ATP-dependent carboligase
MYDNHTRHMTRHVSTRRARTRPRAEEALVISSGLQGLAVTRALGERGVPVVVAHTNPNDLAPSSRHATRARLVPRPEHDGEGFADALLTLAEDHAGAVLIPTTDEATRDVARHERELARHYRLACPSHDVVERTVDKAYTYDLAAARGVPIPATFNPETGAELDVSRGASAIHAWSNRGRATSTSPASESR